MKWVGLRNYARILTDEDIWANMQTTAHFLIWTIVLQVLIGFTLAWLINRKFKGNDLLTTLIVLPMMLSPAVVGNFWTFLYQPQIGLVNYIVEFFTGIPASSFSMLGPGGLAPWSIIIVDTWMWTPFVMLICLAGLRSIPDYIYEAAEVDRASKWRQFWTITVPMVLPFLMLAVLFRGIENFKMFDMVDPADRRRPGQRNAAHLDRPEARSVREMAHRLFLGLRDHPVRHRLRPRLDLREGPEQGEGTVMRTHRAPPTKAVRRHPATPSPAWEGREGVADPGAHERLFRHRTLGLEMGAAPGHALHHHHPAAAGLDHLHQLQDRAGPHLLPAQGVLRAHARRLREPLHHPHPPRRVGTRNPARRPTA